MRLNFEFNESQMASFRTLQERTGAGSMKDLLNHAITLLEWAVDETAEGNEIAAVNDKRKTYRVLVTPLLNYVAKHPRNRMPVEDLELVEAR